MITNEAWRELYRSALMELRPEELRRRIAVAEKAIEQRMAELRQQDAGFEEERRALDDALRGLRVLKATECRPPNSTPSWPAASDVTS